MMTLQERLRAHMRYAQGIVPFTMSEAAARLDELEREVEALKKENAALLAALEQMRCDAIKNARSKT